jgi:hypothetical protein
VGLVVKDFVDELTGYQSMVGKTVPVQLFVLGEAGCFHFYRQTDRVVRTYKLGSYPTLYLLALLQATGCTQMHCVVPFGGRDLS